MRSNSAASPGRDGCLSGKPAAGLGLPQQPGQPDPALADILLLAGEIAVELAQDLRQVPVGVTGQRVAHLVQAQAQLGQAPDPGQLDGVPQ